MTLLLKLLALTALQVDPEVAPPLIPAFFTGERLLEICSRPNAGQCSMYVAGVVDGVFHAETNKSARSLCSGDMTNREAAKIVTDYLREHPEVQKQAAAVAVELALTPEIGCDADEQP
jgi:hypothetical protein